jgi:glucose-6-phosphate 1-dehydrogenase
MRTLFFFGGTGNLAQQKLYPALYRLFTQGTLTKEDRIVGIGRRDIGDDGFKELVKKSLEIEKITPENLISFSAILQYYSLDVGNPEGYTGLASMLVPEALPICYLAVDPNLVQTIIFNLDQSGIAKFGEGARVILEKSGKFIASIITWPKKRYKIF